MCLPEKQISKTTLHRMLCNSFIQPDFDHAYSAWYPNLDEKFKNKIQIEQNIPFLLKIG